MSATISLVETDVFTTLRSFLLSFLSPGTEVTRTLINRVSEPLAVNFVTMTPLLRTRISTNIDAYQDLIETGFTNALQPTQFTMQLDFHGPLSGDNAQIFTTLWRDEYAADFFAAGTVDAQALYASEPRQMAFVNGENQYEERWSVDAVMQINPVVSTPLQFADTLDVVIVEVDTLTFGITENGNVLVLTSPPAGYPTSSVGLANGALYTDGGLICVAGVTSPAPYVLPVYFYDVSAATLLIMGGANLPLVRPVAGSQQLWNNGGVVSAA